MKLKKYRKTISQNIPTWTWHDIIIRDAWKENYLKTSGNDQKFQQCEKFQNQFANINSFSLYSKETQKIMDTLPFTRENKIIVINNNKFVAG